MSSSSRRVQPVSLPAGLTRSRLSYIAFLDMLRHGKVERTLDVREKSLPAYLEYVQTLHSYLMSFFSRALPLLDLEAKMKEDEDSFASAWEADQVSGWAESSTKPKAAPIANARGIWCPYCASSCLEEASGLDENMKQARSTTPSRRCTTPI